MEGDHMMEQKGVPFANYPIVRCAGRDSEIDAGKAFDLLHLPSFSRLKGNRPRHARAKH